MARYDNEREKDNDKQKEEDDDELSDLEYMRRLYNR